MGEAEWLACTDPLAMLEYLRGSGKLSERKSRLFAVACCRSIWDWMSEPLRRVVEMGERYADGLAPRREDQQVADLVFEEPGGCNGLAVAALNTIAGCYERDDPFHIGSDTAAQANTVVDGRLAQCHLLCDLFGPVPFRPTALDPSWRTPDVLALAEAAYEERDLPSGTLDPARLAVLADALEEMGCRDQQILQHLRGPGPHVRGCWAVDLILGKE
jgi:hypothetical protein